MLGATSRHVDFYKVDPETYTGYDNAMAESGKESELRKQERNKADEGHLKRKRNESENAPKITVIKLFTILYHRVVLGGIFVDFCPISLPCLGKCEKTKTRMFRAAITNFAKVWYIFFLIAYIL